MKNPLSLDQATIKAQTNRGYVPSTFAADQGVISQSLFRVSIPAVQKFLREHNPPIIPECGEAHNHNNGTPYIEHIIRQIKELIRFAILYLLRNPNFASFHFTRRQCLRLWGELFYWAIAFINLKPSYNKPTITRYEHYLTTKPDLRTIRLLPIFSSLYVLRRAKHAELHSQHDLWQLGLYVGPSPSVPGAIRAAVHVNNDDVHIITTSAFKGVSDGDQNPDSDVPPPSHSTPRTTAPTNPLLLLLDPVTVTTPSDPDLLPSETDSDPSLLDPRINGTVNSAPDPVLSDSSPNPQPQSLSPPLPQRGSRRKPVKSSPRPAPPALQDTSTESSTHHTYNTRKKKPTSLPVALQTAIQPLTTAADLFAFSASLIVQPYQTHYVDWTNLIPNDRPDSSFANLSPTTHEGFRAIKVNVPKTFVKALIDPEWEKLKEGKVVRKVRLVINGRNHTKHGNTYSPTPSREEFLILLHIIATLDFDYWHLDEKRAFLTAEKTDKHITLARILGDPNYYEILKAVYGLKTSSHDYQQKVIARMTQLGFTRLHIC
eukprot:gene33627-43460_t